jgi:F-type H+-transporting ATPase subunit epsilon
MMQNTFELRIVNVAEALFDGPAISLICRGTSGELTVLAHHEPFISTLEKGPLRVATTDGEHTFEIKDGVLEVAGNRATVLCSLHAEEVPEN